MMALQHAAADSSCSIIRVYPMHRRLTGKQQRVLREGDAGGLGQQARHSDALGLEPLVQRVQFVCRHCVRHPELWHLWTQKIYMKAFLCNRY
jgi:hypothetical protein